MSSISVRARELAELNRGLADVAAGHNHLFRLSGEPGIDKTKLADEFGRLAVVHGVRVIWGRCWAGGGTPAYWPCIQIVRACFESFESDRHRQRSIPKSEIGAQVAGGVAKIVPELRSALGDEPPASKSSDMENPRFRSVDAVATLLKTLAHQSPFLMVIDDPHDAYLASLAMLGFFAREVHDARIMIVGTTWQCRNSYFLLGDPGEARRWWELELLLARTASSSFIREIFYGLIEHACLEQSRLG